jgi:hypothetical protein
VAAITVVVAGSGRKTEREPPAALCDENVGAEERLGAVATNYKYHRILCSAVQLFFNRAGIAQKYETIVERILMMMRPPVTAMKDHPQKDKVIDALLNGQSTRQIASWLNPSMSYATVSRFCNTYVKPCYRNASKLKLILNQRDTETATVLQEGATPVQQRVTGNVSDTPRGQIVKQAIMSIPMLQLREARIAAKKDRWARLKTIVDERAATMADIPGGSSGFLTKDYKGENVIHSFDAGLFKAFGETEKDLAIEVGQWQEAGQFAGVSVQIVMPTSSGSSEMPRVSYASEDVLTLDAGSGDGFEDIGVASPV